MCAVPRITLRKKRVKDVILDMRTRLALATWETKSSGSDEAVVKYLLEMSRNLDKLDDMLEKIADLNKDEIDGIKIMSE